MQLDTIFEWYISAPRDCARLRGNLLRYTLALPARGEMVTVKLLLGYLRS